MRLLLAAAFIACCGACGGITSRPAAHAADFASLEGAPWAGTLTYIDYATGKATTIPSTLRVEPLGPGAWRWSIGYSDEPHADSTSTVRVVDDEAAVMYDDTREPVVHRSRDGATTEIITEFTGEDDSRPATIRRKYLFSAHEFSVRKLVRHADAPDFFKRHEYRWTR
jgi:hypothetical protein